MPLDPNQIKVGFCYAVENQAGPSKPDQHRRVVAIKNGIVTYESWGGGVGYQGTSLPKVNVSLDKFAMDVREEIPCSADLPAMPCIE